jgi:cytochrome b5
MGMVVFDIMLPFMCLTQSFAVVYIPYPYVCICLLFVQSVWTIIHGRVYDVTKFQEEHPGGPDILLQFAGIDSSDDFEAVAHSKNARLDLINHQVGVVEDFTPEKYPMPEMEDDDGEDEGESNPLVYIIPLLIIAIAIVYQFFLKD